MASSTHEKMGFEIPVRDIINYYLPQKMEIQFESASLLSKHKLFQK